MKKSFFILLVLTYVVTFSQDMANETVGPIESIGVFKFKTETINYGTIKQHADGKRTFNFKNVGNAPIIVSKIKTSCGCTSTTKLTEPILPGETAEINVSYATKRLGKFSKTITITSDAFEKVKTIRIKGLIVAE